MKRTHLRERKLLKIVLKIINFPKNHKIAKCHLNRKKKKIVCFICGEENFARFFPKKIVKSNPNKESPTLSENNKISTIIHDGSAKNYTSHPLTRRRHDMGNSLGNETSCESNTPLGYSTLNVIAPNGQ